MVSPRAVDGAADGNVAQDRVKLALSLYHVAIAGILGAILIVALSPRLDTDFWWHLKDGQYIVLHHLVPAKDFMSYTMGGHSWTDHEWLAEVAIYQLFRLAGLWGPIVFFALVITVTFWFVYARMSGQRVNPVLAAFVLAAAFVASSASWGPRIQMLTLLFLSVFLWVLQRFEQTHRRRWLAWLPALMLIWANVHGGFVLGLGLLAITIVGEWLNQKTRRPTSWSQADLRALALTFVVTAGVTILNPNTFRQLLYPLTFVLPNAYTNLIQESASPNFHLPVMMIFEAMLLLLISAAFIARARLNWTHLLLVLAFTHLALSQVRNVAVWAVVVSPLVAYYLGLAGPKLKEHFPGLDLRRRPVGRRIATALNLTLLGLLALAYALEATHFLTPASLRQAQSQNYPAGAIAYMKEHRLPRPVFVSYSWGGYLLWNLFPRYRDYMDSRADTLFTDRILKGYLTMYAAQPGWSGALKANGVQDVLVETKAPLAQVLRQEPGWRLLYSDGQSVLFTRS